MDNRREAILDRPVFEQPADCGTRRADRGADDDRRAFGDDSRRELDRDRRRRLIVDDGKVNRPAFDAAGRVDELLGSLQRLYGGLTEERPGAGQRHDDVDVVRIGCASGSGR